MPSINRIAVALNRITENQYNFDVIEQLNIEKNLNNKNNLKEINFNNEISLENVNFKYPDAKERKNYFDKYFAWVLGNKFWEIRN